MDPAWLGGVAAFIAASTGVAAIISGRRQNQRSSNLEADRIRSEANDELIQNLRADNAGLRGELADLRVRLEQVSRDCRDCREQLDKLDTETYGRRMYRPTTED